MNSDKIQANNELYFLTKIYLLDKNKSITFAAHYITNTLIK
jgi:hypothetical protein